MLFRWIILINEIIKLWSNIKSIEWTAAYCNVKPKFEKSSITWLTLRLTASTTLLRLLINTHAYRDWEKPIHIRYAFGANVCVEYFTLRKKKSKKHTRSKHTDLTGWQVKQLSKYRKRSKLSDSNFSFFYCF